MFVLVALLLAWQATPGASQCTGGTASSCRAQTCCGASGGTSNPPCFWVIQQQCNPHMICHELRRKRLLANLTEIFGFSDSRIAEREVLETDFPLPDSLAHLAEDIHAERKRFINGYCECQDFACCARDCIPQSWSAWSACSASCGMGSRSRSLSYDPPVCGGANCVETSQTDSCYLGGCPTNCQVSAWSGWTCSTSCGPGTQTRSRYITVPEANGGSCPESGSLTESGPCNPGCCPQNCAHGPWSAWSACSAGCGGGSQSRSRSISPALCGGSCGDTQDSQSQSCNTHCCAQNCQIGGWSNWGACSAPCGGGSQSRSRSIVPESCGGSCSTSVVSDSQTCNTGCCPQHCQVGTWSQWGSCSAMCGGGTHSRSRAVTVVAACGGNACPTDLSESEPCGGSCCAVNCVLNAWSTWSACTQSCGGGTRSRSRTKQTPESCGGTCAVLSENEACNTGCCPSSCVWAPFTAWSGCSVTCGAGTQSRSRTVQTMQACGGTCPGAATDMQSCNQPACAEPAVNCEVSPWAAWSTCSATCGASATKARSRTVTRMAAHGGTPCPSLSDTANCGLGCCPVACVVSTWTPWSSCSATCGSGTRSRSRTATTDASCNGTPCSSLSDSEPCSAAAACASDCQLSMWSNWSVCSQQCGTGEQRRTRAVVAAPSNGGAACGALSESQPCTQAACACAVSEWSTWTPCSASCGGGTTTRSRNVTMAASDCPPLNDSKACGTQPCARDCVLSMWAGWSACTVSCGGGRRTRARTVTQAAVEPGMACPSDLTESEVCGSQACAAAGLACAEYTACTDCTDNGKTSPNVCQFCGQLGGIGVCQSLHVVDGDSSSGLRACPIGFDARSTSIGACSASSGSGGVGSTTGAPEVVETVDVASVFKLAMHETTALADVTLGGGVRLQVRVVGEQGAMVRALGDEGFGAYSPSRDGASAANATNMHGRLRAGLSMEFLFAKERPVSFKRLVLGSWDAADEGQLDIGNDNYANGTSKRDVSGALVMIRNADSSFEEETAPGYTKYVLSASGDSDFSVKSFMFTVRTPMSYTGVGDSQAQIDTASGGLDTLTIALIAGGACLCLVVVVVVIVVLARRHRDGPNEKNSSNGPIVASGIGMEMRPALSGIESSLVHQQQHSDQPPPFATLSSVASEDSQYRALAVSPPPPSSNQYQSPRTDGRYHAPDPAGQHYHAKGATGLIEAINSSASYEALPLAVPAGQPHVGQYRGVPPRPEGQLERYTSVPAIDGGTYEISGSAYMPLPQQPII